MRRRGCRSRSLPWRKPFACGKAPRHPLRASQRGKPQSPRRRIRPLRLRLPSLQPKPHSGAAPVNESCMESPIGFLRNVGRLLRPEGVAVLTTPNVDNAPARVKFLLTGTVRMMDAKGEPTHISPIFQDLFVRQYLPRAGMDL